MNANSRNRMPEHTSPVNGEGAQASASARVEIPMSDTAADLHTIQIFFGMSANRLQALWDLCQGNDRMFYRQKVAEMAELTRILRRHTNGRSA